MSLGTRNTQALPALRSKSFDAWEFEAKAIEQAVKALRILALDMR